MPSPSRASYFAMVTADAARIMIVAMDMAMVMIVVRQTGIRDLFEVPQYTLQERLRSSTRNTSKRQGNRAD